MVYSSGGTLGCKSLLGPISFIVMQIIVWRTLWENPGSATATWGSGITWFYWFWADVQDIHESTWSFKSWNEFAIQLLLCSDLLTQHNNVITMDKKHNSTEKQYFSVWEPCRTPLFTCSLGGGHCIMMEWVMDGRMDCKDGSDEGRSEYGVDFRVLLHVLIWYF